MLMVILDSVTHVW